jgi:hypothetical protein
MKVDEKRFFFGFDSAATSQDSEQDRGRSEAPKVVTKVAIARTAQALTRLRKLVTQYVTFALRG